MRAKMILASIAFLFLGGVEKASAAAPGKPEALVGKVELFATSEDARTAVEVATGLGGRSVAVSIGDTGRVLVSRDGGASFSPVALRHFDRLRFDREGKLMALLWRAGNLSEKQHDAFLLSRVDWPEPVEIFRGSRERPYIESLRAGGLTASADGIFALIEREGPVEGTFEVLASKDGKVWQDFGELPDAIGAGSDLSASDGRLYASYGDERGLHVLRSRDRGATWKEVLKREGFPAWTRVFSFADGTVRVFWENLRTNIKGDTATSQNQVAMESSADDGGTWKPARIIHDGPSAERKIMGKPTAEGALLKKYAIAPACSASENGRILACVYRAGADRGGPFLHVVLSRDGGETWSAETELAPELSKDVEAHDVAILDGEANVFFKRPANGEVHRARVK